jgi:hypothetical protein
VKTRASGVRVSQTIVHAVDRATSYGERVVLRRKGKEVAAVIPIEDLRLLESIEDEKDLNAARRAKKEKGSIPWEKLKSELGL